ncbi:MAG TPA: polysaccharide biosynthesis/export family protein, partial [Methylotenera sp.]|nr:polysaccharide biosynthesis/export family protein [Methylotenera sp.]
MRIKTLLWLIIGHLLMISVSVANAEVSQSYRLRQGDLIQVSVWGEDKLQKESVVLPDGSITYP